MPTQWEIGSHQVQATITVTLLVATSILALLCDWLRFRMHRATAPTANPAPEPRKHVISSTLVPEIEIAEAAPKSNRASRLATALKQPRRVLSPAAQAIIERNSQFDSGERAPEKKTTKKSKLRRAG